VKGGVASVERGGDISGIAALRSVAAALKAAANKRNTRHGMAASWKATSLARGGEEIASENA